MKQKLDPCDIWPLHALHAGPERLPDDNTSLGRLWKSYLSTAERYQVGTERLVARHLFPRFVDRRMRLLDEIKLQWQEDGPKMSHTFERDGDKIIERVMEDADQIGYLLKRIWHVSNAVLHCESELVDLDPLVSEVDVSPEITNAHSKFEFDSDGRIACSEIPAGPSRLRTSRRHPIFRLKINPGSVTKFRGSGDEKIWSPQDGFNRDELFFHHETEHGDERETWGVLWGNLGMTVQCSRASWNPEILAVEFDHDDWEVQLS